jgi:outer membrane protein OmpA-like peptidoglycan-associated protein
MLCGKEGDAASDDEEQSRGFCGCTRPLETPIAGGLVITTTTVSVCCNNEGVHPSSAGAVQLHRHGKIFGSRSGKNNMPIQNFSPRVAAYAALHVAAALTFALGAVAARAQTVMVYEEGQAPSAQDIADILSRGASENTKLRGLPTQNGRSPFALLEQTPTKTVNEASAVSVPVHFEFDSAVLSPKAKEQLDVIAEGIRLTEGTIKVVVEGHTDAKGSVHYNESLSYRRAASVRAYLVSSKKLPVTLLTVEGKGPHKLLNKADPYSSANRRVQFRAG